MPDLVYLTRPEAGLACLTMDDAVNRNRFSFELCTQLGEALGRLQHDESISALILCGRPDVFCAGATLESLRDIAAGRVDVRDVTLVRQILEFPVPVIAAVQGHAVGGGLVLAAACDLAIASETSRYGVNFMELGFTPGMGCTFLLPDLVGRVLAAEMMFTGRFYKGRELRGLGLFSRVAGRDEVIPAATDLALQIAAKPRHALILLKDTLASPRRAAIEEALSRESLMHRVCFSRPETAARLDAAYLR